jgi:hypothetical protein
MRKTLGQNSFHRRMLKILGVCAAQMVGFRTVGLLLHLLPAQLVAMEMIGLAATTLLVATQLLRPIWPVPIILVGGSLLLTQRPDLLWPVLPGLYPIVGVMLLTAWNGAAKGLLKAEPSG